MTEDEFWADIDNDDLAAPPTRQWLDAMSSRQEKDIQLAAYRLVWAVEDYLAGRAEE